MEEKFEYGDWDGEVRRRGHGKEKLIVRGSVQWRQPTERGKVKGRVNKPSDCAATREFTAI